jgi:hypothetical protein
MFGRNRQPKEDNSAAFGEMFGVSETTPLDREDGQEYITDYHPGDIYYGFVPKNEYQDDGRVVRAERVGYPGEYEDITVDEYKRRKGLTDEQILAQANYRPPEDLIEMRHLARAKLGAHEEVPAGNAGKFKIKGFELKIDEFKGDAQTLAQFQSILGGAPAQSPGMSFLEMMLQQKSAHTPDQQMHYDIYDQPSGMDSGFHHPELAAAPASLPESWDDEEDVDEFSYPKIIDLSTDEPEQKSDEDSGQQNSFDDQVGQDANEPEKPKHKKLALRKLVGALALTGVVAYGSYGAISRIPLLGFKEHQIQNIDFKADYKILRDLLPGNDQDSNK